MHALRGDAERYRAMVALETPVLSGRVDDVGIIVETGGASPIQIAVNAVVNAAGLGSHAFAALSLECLPTRFRHYILRRETTPP